MVKDNEDYLNGVMSSSQVFSMKFSKKIPTKLLQITKSHFSRDGAQV